LPPVLFTPSDRALGRGEYRSAIEITLDKSLELAGLASTINKVVDFILFFFLKEATPTVRLIGSTPENLCAIRSMLGTGGDDSWSAAAMLGAMM
jgi:hypothetical protein